MPVTTQLPALAVLAGAAAGVLLAAAVDWQVGAYVLGLALLTGAGLRLVLPAGQLGWLAVRSRGLDATLLLGLGFGLCVLAGTIPPA